MPGGLGFCLCLFCPWDRSTDAGDQKYSGVEALIFFSPNEGGKRQGLPPRLCYFVSQVHALDKNGVVSRFWEKLFSDAKLGAIFLYDDNGHDMFNKYIDERAAKAGLKTLLSENNVRWTPRYSEQASELGDFRQQFGHHPKLQGYLSYRAFTKE